MRPEKTPSNLRVVHNLSDKTLSEAATNVLRKGFNFAIAPKHVPVEDIITGVETAIGTLNHETAHWIRQDVTTILRRSEPPKSNMSKAEIMAMKELKLDPNIVILPADKGNATVVMNRDNYHQKIKDLLQDKSYKKITSDPTTYLEKTTKTKIIKSPLDEQTKKRLIPREKSSQCPKLYGLPKVHKENTPLRPIVSSTGSPTQALAKYLAENLQPIAEKMESYVKNANHFIELISDRKMEDTDLLVSFDVKSLFTQVPIDESLHIIERDHNQPEYFVELARHCLTNTYFIYNNERYKQVEGAPMGSPLSPIIANIFMENFEKKALATTTDKPSLWLRYVDDTFVVWPHGEEKLKIFLQHLNTVHPRIEFTMEVEEKGQLPFLDVLVIKKPDGTLGHTVYRKPTHTERYLNAESHHHPAQLFSVVNTLVSRSQMLADQEHRQEELKHIRETLIHNGYDDNVVNKALRKRSRTATQVQEKSQSKAFLPYVKGTTDRISRVLRKHDIETIFTTSKKLGDTLRNYKDKIPLENQGVYEIPCGDCSSSYVGQTNRKVSVRRDEHKLAVQKREPTSSLAQHVVNTGHNINFAETRILARSTNLHSRIVREAIEIDKRPHNLNKRDDSQRLPQAWKPLLRTYTARQPDTNNTHRSLNSETSGPMTKQQQHTDHALPTTQADTATEGTYINAQYSSQRSPIVTRSRRRCQR